MGFFDWICDVADDARSRLSEFSDGMGDAISEFRDGIADAVDELVIDLGGKPSDRVRKRKIGIEYGDIVGVSRGIYDHYGVYVGEDEVIHYTSDTSDIGDNSIQVTSFSIFLKESNEYFVLVFPKIYGEPVHVKLSHNLMDDSGSDIKYLEKFFSYKLRSPEETVKRARSRIGESEYNLVTQNCEHFAIWCKTGISESHQINRLLGKSEKQHGMIYY